MSLFKIAFARTGQEISIEATDWHDAVRQTGRRDACYITSDATGKPPVEVLFDADVPQGIGAQTIERALAEAVAFLDSEEAAK
ncbi:hypothetical protein [Halomonas sp. Mc5H-6]|uniref:hypothetical protein n=1 Tax=Halomonas sp. Mc5H-6 TaxID=2954500 RepID=UPI002097D5D5|nr:hypothetical protein [Halomonas sp. Mc5H-6]MCO7248064.1 hypothetical protein [Halomonas sp. Mc5H-6]